MGAPGRRGLARMPPAGGSHEARTRCSLLGILRRSPGRHPAAHASCPCRPRLGPAPAPVFAQLRTKQSGRAMVICPRAHVVHAQGLFFPIVSRRDILGCATSIRVLCRMCVTAFPLGSNHPGDQWSFSVENWLQATSISGAATNVSPYLHVTATFERSCEWQDGKMAKYLDKYMRGVTSGRKGLNSVVPLEH